MQLAFQEPESQIFEITRLGFESLMLFHYLKRARQPENSVKAKKCKGPDEYESHEPETIEKDRVFTAIVMGGMSKVSCKTTMRTRVTLGAGFHDVLPGETGLRIAGW